MESKRFKRGDRLKVKIERLSAGGRGVARADGLVIFVPGVAPDEKVEIELTAVKKNFAEAQLRHVIVPGPARVFPPCPVANVCGGCNWQHIAYHEQLRQKRLLVAEALRKFSGFEINEDFIAETVPSPKQFRYRNRVQLHHSGPRIGFFKRASHEIVDIDDCLITEEKLAAEIPRLKKELAHQKKGRVELYLTTTGEPALRKSHVNSDEGGATGPAFSQVNTAQNEQLVRSVLGIFQEILASDKSQRRIFDLYAGSGNFSFPLAEAFNDVPITAVELNAESIRHANSQLQRSNLGNLSFKEADVEEYLKSESPAENDIVLLDPPRTGCSKEVISILAESAPAHIVYVSCNPVTLARDLRPLHDVGYSLVSVTPFDMFPQTDHVEVLTHLSRSTRPRSSALTEV